ncbi:MAG: hypothetical protein AAGA80_27360 [Cyanobacteria bacterium P01_F01_bin.143]
MNQLHFSNTPYKVGGSLSYDEPSYVWRKVDHLIYQLLLQGEFCYVFNSRQMGKSSLKLRVKKRLEKAGVACSAIDITGIIDSTKTTQ